MSLLVEEIIDASGDFIALVNADHVYEFINRSFRDELGESSPAGRSIAEVWGETDFARRLAEGVDRALTGRDSVDFGRLVVRGAPRYVQASFHPYPSVGVPTHALVYAHDVSLVKDLQSRLLSYEYRDETTGLFNRKSFEVVLDMELEKARRHGEGQGEAPLRALMLIGLEGLAEVNARHGVEVGDLVLETSALRVRETLRASDYVFRFEGRELAVILCSLRRGTDLPVVGEHLRLALGKPFRRDGAEIRVEARMGVALFPADATDREGLMKSAFAALNDAREGGAPLALFDRDLYRRAVERTRIKADIRRALVEEQFELRFQPIVDSGGRVAGAEALIRWRHPELGLVSPADFIPVAEESDDIRMIGRWVLFQVCARLEEWSPRFPGLYVSLNLSPREFEDGATLELIAEVVSRHPAIGRGALKLEITETQAMRHVEETVARMEGLAERGLEVLIDDFGSGYSSLAWLKVLPAKVIKVDQSFARGIAGSGEDRLFMGAMLDLIRSRGKKVLVEGVEDAGTVEILRGMGCDLMQGYHFSKPVEAAEFLRLLEVGGTLPRA